MTVTAYRFTCDVWLDRDSTPTDVLADLLSGLEEGFEIHNVDSVRLQPGVAWVRILFEAPDLQTAKDAVQASIKGRLNRSQVENVKIVQTRISSHA